MKRIRYFTGRLIRRMSAILGRIWEIISDVWENKPVLVATCVGVAGLCWWWRVRAQQEPKPPANWYRDVVYIYTFPRKFTKQVVNLSPFAMKIETSLRMHKIKYEVVETFQRSSRRIQIPYVWFNGKWLEDSGLIIKHLTSHFKLDETEGLTEAERGVSLAFIRMIESHTSWTIFSYRYVTNTKEYNRVFQLSQNKIAHAYMARRIKSKFMKISWGHGMGRYTDDERADLGRCDVTAISNFLGDKPYMLGDRMTLLDCCVFGHLCQVVLVDMPYPHKTALKGKGENLVRYIDRIKDLLWPDWDILCDVKGRFQ